jgi:cytoskeletal protein CcmA (bactofilin family)
MWASCRGGTILGEKMTIIDVNAAVTGQFHGKDIQILGRFGGELRVSGSFVMGEGSHVEAKVQAERAEISGKFAGEIVARHLVFLEKANVSGTVDTQTLAVHEGAVINGPVTAGEGARASLDPTPPTAAVTGSETLPPAAERASLGGDAGQSGDPGPGSAGPGDPEHEPESGHRDEAPSAPAAPEPDRPNE